MWACITNQCVHHWAPTSGHATQIRAPRWTPHACPGGCRPALHTLARAQGRASGQPRMCAQGRGALRIRYAPNPLWRALRRFAKILERFVATSHPFVGLDTPIMKKIREEIREWLRFPSYKQSYPVEKRGEEESNRVQQQKNREEFSILSAIFP